MRLVSCRFFLLWNVFVPIYRKLNNQYDHHNPNLIELIISKLNQYIEHGLNLGVFGVSI